MPVVTITGLKTLSGADLTTNPSINTDAPFNLANASFVPSSCAGYISMASSQTSADNLLLSYQIGINGPTSLTTLLTNLKEELVPADQGMSVTGKAGYDDQQVSGTNVKDFITSIQNSYLPVIRILSTCLRESLQVDQSALVTAKDKLNESKSRYESITNPERNVSYYEGWFPMVRPMTEPALFGLFGAAIFMLLVSILIFLRLSGVQLDIQIPESTFALPPNASYYMYGGVVAGIIGAVAYGYLRKK